jgi:hypothetical protein
MKYLGFAIIFLISISCFGQTKKSDTTFTINYFANKKISTKQVNLNNELLWGYAVAYNQEGKQIYWMQTRRAAGHASVQFWYYPSGAVSKAHFTSHPDGGIQWSDITHYFDEFGNVTNVDDRSSDMYGHPRLTTIYTLEPYLEQEKEKKQEVKKENPTVIKPQPEVAKCAEIYQSNVFVVNLSGRNLRLSSKSKNRKIEDTVQNQLLQRGDTLKVASYIEAQMFTHPKEFLEIAFEKQQKNIRLFWDDFVQDGKAKRNYFLFIIDTKRK